MPEPLRALVLVVRFGLELCLLGALAWAGASVDGPLALKVVLALVLPAAAAYLWGMFVSPKRRARVSEPVRLAIELGLFGAAALGLVLIGQVVLGFVFAAVALVWSVLARL